MTREKEFYEQFYQPNVFGEDNPKYILFRVPIGNAKNIYMHGFHPHAPEIEYVQDNENTCCLSSLDFFADNEHVG